MTVGHMIKEKKITAIDGLRAIRTLIKYKYFSDKDLCLTLNIN